MSNVEIRMTNDSEERMTEADLVTIDGSQGEGGGQIVRSAIALSLVTGRGVRIEDIRAGRQKPGLMRQHLTAVQAAAEVGRAHVEGEEVGSRAITFIPSTIKPGNYFFRVGTAGSATLVLQTVLPALMIADGPSKLILEGGTHNPWAPPFDFLDKTFFPLVNRMGPRIRADLEQYGFYPAGGGRFTVWIQPEQMLSGFDLLTRGEITSRRVRAIVANLPRHIGEREIKTIAAKSNWDKRCFEVEEVENAAAPGNVVLIELESSELTEVMSGFGRPAVRAEKVAAEVLNEARDYLQADVPVGPHLADQLMLPLGMSAWQRANGAELVGGSFRTLPLTRHAHTHAAILRQMLGVAVDVVEEGGSCLVRIAKRP
jgi:RNA 3'-terminal phosphate cyclase (ATP)